MRNGNQPLVHPFSTITLSRLFPSLPVFLSPFLYRHFPCHLSYLHPSELLKMPRLSEIGYSRDACIAAVRDYYSFLTKMYLKESIVMEPPEGGWPAITAGKLRGLGKTDEVISLLRYLPYIRFVGDLEDDAQGAPSFLFADWNTACTLIDKFGLSAEDFKYTDGDFGDDVPPHVVGLTSGREDSAIILLSSSSYTTCTPGLRQRRECAGQRSCAD